MELFIGDFVIEPIHILIFFVVLGLIAFVIWMMRRQQKANVAMQRKAIVQEAGPEVPIEAVNLDGLEIVIKPETEETVEQFSTARFKVFTKPNTAVSFNIAVNGSPVTKMGPGFFEYTFEEAGEYTITATLIEHPTIYKEIKVPVAEFDFTKIQLSLTKYDGSDQTTLGSNDYYSVEVKPEYPLKVNIYVDEQYYTQVQGSNSFQCYFNQPGDHTFYAALDANPKIYTNYLTISAVDQGSGEEEQSV